MKEINLNSQVKSKTSHIEQSNSINFFRGNEIEKEIYNWTIDVVMYIFSIFSSQINESNNRSTGENNQQIKANREAGQYKHTPYFPTKYLIISSDSYIETPVFGSTCKNKQKFKLRFN